MQGAVKQKKWRKKKNGLFGWVTICTSDTQTPVPSQAPSKGSESREFQRNKKCAKRQDMTLFGPEYRRTVELNSNSRDFEAGIRTMGQSETILSTSQAALEMENVGSLEVGLNRIRGDEQSPG